MFLPAANTYWNAKDQKGIMSATDTESVQKKCVGVHVCVCIESKGKESQY